MLFMKSLDLLGQRFGRLTVVEKLPSKNNMSMWRCVCDCGNETAVLGKNLKSGRTKSCGCLQKETFAKNTNNPPTHRATGTRLHNEWRAMKARCYIPSCSNYERYGGRGIRVCDEWKNDFLKFKEWALENGYNDDLSIDRINPDGDYEPNNCRWVTMQKQFWNRGIRKTNKSGVSGVYFDKSKGRWRAHITVNRKRIDLGTYLEKEDAVKARKCAEKEYWQ